MNTTLVMPQQSQSLSVDMSIQKTLNSMIDELITSLPDPKQLTSEERRGIIARYTAVLEGNFIYWMTATLLAVESEESRPILLDNLHEEVRDAHPAMLRRFAIAAHAFPTDTDALAVHDDLTNVRLFLGRLSGVQSVLTMAFFEGFIQRFMGYLSDLATAQGSLDMEYTDVHGVCDIAHTEGLLNALAVEMAINPLEPEKDLYEGAYLLRTLLQTIVFDPLHTLPV
jgi:Iron-containing redox enzyme